MEDYKFKHLMVDIETLGTRPGKIILSVGAVFFDLATGETGNQFYYKINLIDSINHGFTIDTDTVGWWAAQKPEALKEALSGIYNKNNTIHKFVNAFSRWIVSSSDPADIEVWGNSARFDLGMLEPYFEAVKQDFPWRHYKERDVRTLVAFREDIKLKHITNEAGENITTHNPVEDCFSQIRYCSEIYSTLNNK